MERKKEAEEARLCLAMDLLTRCLHHFEGT